MSSGRLEGRSQPPAWLACTSTWACGFRLRGPGRAPGCSRISPRPPGTTLGGARPGLASGTPGCSPDPDLGQLVTGLQLGRT